MQDWRNSERSCWIQSDPLTLVGSFQYIYLNEISSLSYLFGTAEFLTSFLLALFPPETIVQLLSVSLLLNIITKVHFVAQLLLD